MVGTGPERALKIKEALPYPVIACSTLLQRMPSAPKERQAQEACKDGSLHALVSVESHHAFSRALLKGHLRHGQRPAFMPSGTKARSATERKASEWQGPESISVGERPSSLSDSQKSL